MRKSRKSMLLLAALVALAGVQLGSFNAFAKNDKHEDKWEEKADKWEDKWEDKKDKWDDKWDDDWEDKWEDKWDDKEDKWEDKWDHDDDDDDDDWDDDHDHDDDWDDDHHHGGGDQGKTGGMVNVIYFCEETNTVWANGEIWAKGLVDGKGNVNSSELTNIPEGYQLKSVGDFYYDGGPELRIQVIPKSGGYVDVNYEYHNPKGYVEGTVVRNIWASQLVDGKGNVNSSELRDIPKGYHLRFLGDYYYNGDGMLEVEILKD